MRIEYCLTRNPLLYLFANPVSMSDCCGQQLILQQEAVSQHANLCPVYMQALSSPISGVVGNKVDRTHIVSFGCFLWGIMTAAIGMADSLRQV